MRKLLLFTLAFFMLQFSIGQVTIENLKKNFSFGSIVPIQTNGQIKGYMVRYRIDKVDRKTELIKIEIYDENMSPVKSAELVIPKAYTLLEVSFNGAAFIMEYYNSDAKGKDVELVLKTYDLELKEIGSKKNILERKEAIAYLEKIQFADDDKESEQTIFACGTTGFIRYSMEKIDKRIETVVEYVDNKLKTQWKWNTDPTNKLLEVPMYGDGNENYHLTYIIQKKSKVAQTYKIFAILFDVKTGKVLYKNDLKDNGVLLNSALAKVSPEGDVFIAGEYYEGEELKPKTKSVGLFAGGINKEGKYINMQYSAWDKEVAKLIKVDNKGRFENQARVFIHDAIKTSDGKTYLIAEQFKTVANGMAIASMMMSRGQSTGGTALLKVQLLNFMIFTLGPNNALEEINIFEKLKRGVDLPQGFETAPTSYIGKYLALLDLFDYSSTQKDASGNGFNIISQIKAENDEGKKELMIGTISLNSDKKFTTDKIPFKEKGSRAFVYSAKYGYVLMGRFYKKEKKLTLGLEKINQ